MMWSLDEALRFYDRLRPAIAGAGFGLGLTGGVVNNHRSDHDLDVIAYPLLSSVVDTDALHAAMATSGMRLVRDREAMHAGWRARGIMDEKWVEVWEYDGKRVDVMVLR